MKKNKITHNTPSNSVPTIPVLWISVFIILLCLSGGWLGKIATAHMLIKAVVATIGACGLFCYGLWLNRNQSYLRLHFSCTKLFFLALFLFGTLSIFWSLSVDFWVFKWMLWSAAFFTFMVGLNLKLSDKVLRQLAWTIVLGGGGVAIVGIVQYLTDFNLPASAAKPGSTFGNKNMAAQIIVLSLPLCFYLFAINETRKWRVWLLAICLSCLTIFLFYAQSRAAWLSVGCEILFLSSLMFWLRKKVLKKGLWQRKKTLALLFFLMIIVTFVNFNQHGVEPFWKSVLAKVENTYNQATGVSRNERFDIWQTGIEMVKDRPIIGSGLGSYYHKFETQRYKPNQLNGIQRLHNDLIELAVELGALGVLLFLMSVLGLVCSVLVILRQVSGERLYFMMSIVTALVGIVINMQFSFPFQTAVPMVLCALYAALIVQQKEILSVPNALSFQLTPIYKHTLLSLTLAILLFVTVVNFQWIHFLEQFNNRWGQLHLSKSLHMPWINNQEILVILRMSGDFFRVNGMLYQARDIYQLALSDYSESVSLNSEIAKVYIQQKAHNKALTAINRVKDHAADTDLQADFLEMEIYFQQKNDAKLGGLLNTILKSHQENSAQLTPIQVANLHKFSDYLRDKENTR